MIIETHRRSTTDSSETYPLYLLYVWLLVYHKLTVSRLQQWEARTVTAVPSEKSLGWHAKTVDVVETLQIQLEQFFFNDQNLQRKRGQKQGMRISSASPPPMSHNFSIEQCLPALEQLMGESAGTRSKRPGPSYFNAVLLLLPLFHT